MQDMSTLSPHTQQVVFFKCGYSIASKITCVPKNVLINEKKCAEATDTLTSDYLVIFLF